MITNILYFFLYLINFLDKIYLSFTITKKAKNKTKSKNKNNIEKRKTMNYKNLIIKIRLRFIGKNNSSR